MANQKSDQKEESFWEGLGKLAKAIGPFGVPFTAIFMANVLVILCIILLNAQFSYLWLAVLIFAMIEIIIGFIVYVWKEKQLKKEKVME